jgi:chemotaxis protein MotB
MGRKSCSYSKSCGKNDADHTLTNHVWPGFVDALSALLTVVLFAFMIFVVSYVCTRSIMQGKESSLTLLQSKVRALEGKNRLLQSQLGQSALQLTRRQSEWDKMQSLHAMVQDRLVQTESAWQALQNDYLVAQRSVVDLTQRNQDQALQLSDMSQKLEAALLKEIQALSDARSAFFGELKKALKDRKEVRIVGDRFIFSSEILFDLGSASINAKGKKELTAFSHALTDMMQRIPKNVSWVLRVDGHTDLTPIRAEGRFKSNLELSTARAIAVVNVLISQGFPPQRLAAAGFGEFRPLVLGKPSPKDRRIELMFDQGY